MLELAKRGVVFPARIGKGYGWIATGFIMMGLGFLLTIAGSSARDGGMIGFGTLLVSAGALCLVIGFWTRLFAAIEQRLIEIQVATLGDRAREPTPEDHREAAKPSQGYIG